MMNKSRKTSHLYNIVTYDDDGHIVIPGSLTLGTEPASSDNSAKAATTAWIRTYVGSLSYATSASVTSAIAALVDAAPSTLDTLNELAAALGDDPNFATTIATSIGGKLALTGGTLTGDLTLSGINPRLYFTDTDNNPDYFISNTDGTFTVYDVTNSVGRFKIYTTGNAEFTNNLTAASFIKSGGTAAQFLKADGSVDGNTYLTGITSSQVTTALGYTPVTNARTITINGTAYDLSADRSWSIAAGVTSFNTRTGAITLSSADVTTALGYTPYNNTNPSGYITGITSANVTTALGYTPYNSTNPSGYITSSGTAAAISQTVAGGSEANLVYSTVADNDFFRIRVGGSSNAGWAEIATADDGTEPIYVRQYTGVFSSLTRTLTLLDASGNTSTPGSLNVGGYLTVTGAGSSSSIYMSDSDEGQREIHCNSNRIGFLTQAGAWGAWADDAGNWNAANFSGSSSGTNTGDQTNVSGYATYLNSGNYINQRGSTGSWNNDFSSTPAGTANYGGDVGANSVNGPGGSWWIQQNFRHTNASNLWGVQVAWGWEDNPNRLATRSISGGSFGGWVYYLNSSNYTTYVNTLSFNGSTRLYTGSDGTRNTGWAYHMDNSTGLHWPNNGWHFYPKDASDMYVRSGSDGASSLVLNTNGTNRGYVYANSSNEIGFLNNSRGWIMRMTSGGDLIMDNNYGNSIVGVYSSTRFQGVYSMGNAYKLAIDGTSPGNLYGISWGHPNAGGQAGYLNDHGMMVMVNGVTYSAISSNIWARGTITANGSAFANGNRLVENNGGSWGISITGRANVATHTDHYSGRTDSASYNVVWAAGDPSHLYSCNAVQIQSSSGTLSATNVSVGSNLNTTTLYFNGVGGDSGQNSAPGYAIYQQGGAWGYPYPDLCIGYHTGIKMGAYWNYGGIRIYNNSDWGTITASFHDGDQNFRGYYDIIAYASDRRLKHKVQPIENALEKVNSLTGMTYQWNEVGSQHGWTPDTEAREAGVFAQDVQAVLPEAVKLAPFDQGHDKDGKNYSKSGQNFLTVKYEKIVPLLIEAIKEQQVQVEAQQSEIAELKDLVKQLLAK
jgi:hypothetical protein